ncbi:PAS domain-containing protein [Cytobacillus gottheilii]|uniref:PAS domain-containing protein n=1 Tax=Cytobacillus gottheilii TaxID=859144 RepID=UPI0009BC1A8F|nr:PAS domain-containing protein [Cytobacillus gottheilii]
MNEMVSFSPILILVAIGLTFMATYTALDLFSLIHSKESNRKFLFIGGTFSLGIGIWLMNFIGMLAFNIEGSGNYHMIFIFLSMVSGICFTGLAFLNIINKKMTYYRILIGGFFLTLAVLAIHVTGMFAIGKLITFHPILLVISVLLIFLSFSFSLWLMFFKKPVSKRYHSWLKPVSAFIMTGANIEGYLLLIRASSVQSAFQPSENMDPSSYAIYLLAFVGFVILGGVVGSSSVTNRKLSASDHLLADIQSALDKSSIVAITDPKGVITYVNDKFVEISKYSREELIGKTHRILNSDYHPSSFFEEMWKTISSGGTWRGEIKNKAKDGSMYWVETTIVPFLNSKGNIYQYVAIRTDITPLKTAEIDLKESLKEVSDITFALNQSSIVAFTDARGRITSVNDKLCEISKYSREELIGEDHSILNSGYHTRSFFKDLWAVIGNGDVWKGEIRNRAKDGSYYWVDTTIVPFLNDAGKPYQYLAIRNDITERKHSEELLHRQDKLAAVGQLAAGVAHEIRNPLTSMKGYAEFLLLDEQNEERREFIDIILDEIDRVDTIVEDFMVLAKPKAIQLEEKNIIPIIENVISLLEFEARKRNVAIHFEPEQPIIQIECDENRLKQVFLNFIKNGIEAMPDGGKINITIENINDKITIAIQDTGVGIPEDKLKKIGDPFYTTKKNGNGLGLMVSFKIIESHNGKVYIESELNKGTIFNIVLPAKIA